MLGFGVDAAMVLMTPVVLQVAKDVIGFLGEQLRERAREQGEAAIDRVIARIVNRNGGEGEAEPVEELTERAARAGARAGDQEGPGAQALRRARDAARGLSRRESGAGMSAGAATPERRPRLNPFAFPSDTAFRFGLLVAAVFGANLYVWEWIVGHHAARRGYSQVHAACFAFSAAAAASTEQFTAASERVLGLHLAALPLPGRGGCSAEPERCSSPRPRLMLAAPLWITRRRRAATAEGSGRPGRRRRGGRARPRAGPRAAAALLESARRVGGGLAFGHPGRYSVAVGGGLVVKQVADPPAFRAVVRHELAHIRNRDVGITYFALAVWYAFLLVAVIPFVFVAAGRPAHAHQRRLAAGRARAARLPDPERRAPLTRGLRRSARVGTGRAGTGHCDASWPGCRARGPTR